MRVSGIVLLEPDHPALSDSVLRVRLLDVSRLDAASITLAEIVISGVAHRAGEERAVPFTLEAGEEPAPGSSLSVAAHLENSRPPTGVVQRGDLVTTTSNPVPPSGADGVVLRLTRVGAEPTP
jgi:hypothetical protein